MGAKSAREVRSLPLPAYGPPVRSERLDKPLEYPAEVSGSLIHVDSTTVLA
jgi:hypothetical protein